MRCKRGSGATLALLFALLGACRPTPKVLTGEQRVAGLPIPIPSGWGAFWEPDSTLVLFPLDSRVAALRVSAVPAAGPGAVLAPGAAQWLESTRSTDSVFVEGKRLIHMRFWVTRGAVFSLAQQVTSPSDSLRPDYVLVAESVVRGAQGAPR